jgi:hypothetical protein
MAVAPLMSPRAPLVMSPKIISSATRPTHGYRQTGQQFVFAIGVFVFLRQPHGRTKRWSPRDDCDLVQWFSVREKDEQQRVASFVIRSVLFFFLA